MTLSDVASRRASTTNGVPFYAKLNLPGTNPNKKTRGVIFSTIKGKPTRSPGPRRVDGDRMMFVPR